jgi:nucleotide-binding universal stress UspA family protein
VSTAPILTWQCPPKRVLVGVDFGDASTRALAIAGVVASAFEGRLRALHAERFEPPPYFTGEQIARLEAERRTAQAAAADHLTRFAARAAGRHVESIVVDEPPVDAILDDAATADMIIVGTHGRRGPSRWWLGSVAERIVRAATIPVLITRAAVTPPREVFERLVLVHDGNGVDADARACAERLASIVGGSLIEGGAVERCDAAVMRQASLLVVAAGGERPLRVNADAVARVLGSCQQPVLFIPAAEHNKQR